MNVQGNLYTFIYSTVLVIVVALGLAFTSISLKDKQNANIEKEKKQNIMASLGIFCTRDEAVDLYAQHVKKVYAIDYLGNILDDVDAFHIDLKVEYAKEDTTQRHYPVYECEKDGKMIFVFPVYGKGLWGPIWGYVALEEDFNTIYGVNFGHKGETPGLGAEITKPEFQNQFKGKKLFNELDEFVSILVKKPSQFESNDEHQVQGISGASITSRGLQDMFLYSFKPYELFFKSH